MKDRFQRILLYRSDRSVHPNKEFVGTETHVGDTVFASGGEI